MALQKVLYIKHKMFDTYRLRDFISKQAYQKYLRETYDQKIQEWYPEYHIVWRLKLNNHIFHLISIYEID